MVIAMLAGEMRLANHVIDTCIGVWLNRINKSEFNSISFFYLFAKHIYNSMVTQLRHFKYKIPLQEERIPEKAMLIGLVYSLK